MSTFAISGRTPAHPGWQRGLVVVELAITLPLVILIMFATFEFGRAFFQYTTLTKAVEAGTRYYASAVLDPAIDEDRAIDVTISLIERADPNPDGTEKYILLDNNGDNGIDVLRGDISFDDTHVRVSASYSFLPLLGGNLPIYGEIDGIKMTATHTMRAL